MFRLTVVVAVVVDGFCRKILVFRPPMEALSFPRIWGKSLNEESATVMQTNSASILGSGT